MKTVENPEPCYVLCDHIWVFQNNAVKFNAIILQILKSKESVCDERYFMKVSSQWLTTCTNFKGALDWRQIP